MNRLLIAILIFVFPKTSLADHTWSFGPLRNQSGELFSENGGVHTVLDLTFSTSLDQYLMVLRANNGRMMVLGSPNGNFWTTLSSASWTAWSTLDGHDTGTAFANGEALLLLIGNKTVRWPFSTWQRTSKSPFSGDVESIAVKGSKVAVTGWRNNLVYYSNDLGASFNDGFSVLGIDLLAASDAGFCGIRSLGTLENTLLKSNDGSFFSIDGEIPDETRNIHGLIGMGDSLILLTRVSDQYGIYSKKADEDYVFHGFYNESANYFPWKMKYDSTGKGCILALPKRGIIEITSTTDGLDIVAREEVQFNLDWRGAATGSGDSILVTKTGVIASAPFDLSSTDEDSDKDGLLDKFETGTGVFISPTDTGTSPTKEDSDDDGFSDGYEVDNGTDPNLADSKPSSGAAWLKPAVEFSFVARLGQTFRIEKSLDMINWSPVEVGVSGNGAVISRLYPSNPSRGKDFFRAVAE